MPGIHKNMIVISITFLLIIACSSPGTAPKSFQPSSNFTPEHLIKSDFNRFTETTQQHIFISLKRLAAKLYKRNPKEWKKSGAPSMEAAIEQIFSVDHNWRLETLGYRRDIDALQIALHPEYRGDRIQAYVVGLASMIQTALGDREEFYMLDQLDAQYLYNAARNVEIAAWKLANARDENHSLLLLSNEMGKINNLSFEREFGRIIGQLELLSDLTAYATERNVVRAVQNIATAVFLPVH